jgi:hypothetical protein
MADGFSNYLETALLNLTLRATAFTPSTAVWISLHTASPADTGANELSTAVGAYGRVSVNTTSSGFTAPSGGLSDNAGTITFPTATVNWSTAGVTHVGIWDASAAGNFLYGGALTVTKPIFAQDTAVFDIGALDVQLD